MRLNIREKFAQIQFSLPKISRSKNKTITKKSSNKKEKIAILVIVFLGAGILSYTQLSNTDTNSSVNNNVINTSAEITKIANKSAQPQKEKDIQKISTAALGDNPFVSTDKYQNIEDMSQEKQEKLAKEAAKALPTIPNYTPQAYLPGVNNNSSLPPIPTFNVPAMPEKTGQIQGIMSDETGNKLAIVDGKIVKEGDALNGDTISQINNQGITFSNGNKISYNIAN